MKRIYRWNWAWGGWDITPRVMPAGKYHQYRYNYRTWEVLQACQ